MHGHMDAKINGNICIQSSHKYYVGLLFNPILKSWIFKIFFSQKILPTIKFRKALSILTWVICTDGQTDRTNSTIVRFFAIVLPTLFCLRRFTSPRGKYKLFLFIRSKIIWRASQVRQRIVAINNSRCSLQTDTYGRFNLKSFPYVFVSLKADWDFLRSTK